MCIKRSRYGKAAGTIDLELEDEKACTMLLAVEAGDLSHLVMLLPLRLRVVILLLFWEGRSEMEQLGHGTKNSIPGLSFWHQW